MTKKKPVQKKTIKTKKIVDKTRRKVARVDYVEIRKEYMTNHKSSYRSLSKKFGISYTALQQHATKENWPKQRQDLVDKTNEKSDDEFVKIKAECDDRHVLHYKNIQAIANRTIMNWSEKLNKTQSTFEVDARDLANVARALKIGIDGERIVRGLPTTVTGLTDGKGQPLSAKVFDIMGELPDEDTN